MTLRPLHDGAVRRIGEDQKTTSGTIILDTAYETLMNGERVPDSLNAETYGGLDDFAGVFSRLAAPEREVLVVISVDGMSYEDAAVHLAVSVETLKSRLYRARDNLRDRMHENAC